MIELIAGLWRSMKAMLDAAAREMAPDLRPSHVRLLSLTPADGVRVGDLAGIAGMTVQSLGEFVDTLCRAGYMELSTDPSDRRARLVVLTRRGRDIGRAMDNMVRDLETQWRAKVGSADWETFHRVLTQVQPTAP